MSKLQTPGPEPAPTPQETQSRYKGTRTPRRPLSLSWQLPQASLQGILRQSSPSPGPARVGDGVSWMCRPPASFMPPDQCLWASACPVLRSRVSTPDGGGGSYPWFLPYSFIGVALGPLPQLCIYLYDQLLGVSSLGAGTMPGVTRTQHSVGFCRRSSVNVERTTDTDSTL